MISLKKLLDMVWADAVERCGMSEEEWRRRGCPLPEQPKEPTQLSPIRYDLELIEGPDGKVYWVE